jgi:hypothetical protein
MRARSKPPPSPRSPVESLRATMAAVRVSFTWLGVRKTLTPDQKARAAETFGAQENFLSAAKKLLDTSDPAYRQVTQVRSRATSYWKALTLPYPEPGLRLIRQDRLSAFNEAMEDFRRALDDAVRHLDDRYASLQAAARQRLGTLFAPEDYPASLQGLFAIDWELPTVEPPAYLLELDPALYEQEKRRIVARFDEAVQMAQDAFVSEFSKLVSHLTERISEGGKVFRDSAVEGLKAFFERFQALNVHSSGQLDALVAQAQQAVEGVKPQDLRDSDALRKQVAGRLQTVAATLETLLVDQPRRRILRTAAAPVVVATGDRPAHPTGPSGQVSAPHLLGIPVTAAAPESQPVSPASPRPVEPQRQVA